MFFVEADIPDLIPPNTPAMHIPSFGLHIIRSLDERLLSTLSSVTNLLFSGRFFMMTFFPSILSASNECNGWPTSCWTKFVMSTTLFIGLRPTALSLFLSHSGDSAIVTPLIVMPVYLGQSVAFSITTSHGLLLLSILKADTEGSIAL